MRISDWSSDGCSSDLPEAHRARVEPGCVLDTLRGEAERHHLTFGPDPSTHDHNTLYGMIGNNSCGVHSVMRRRPSANTIGRTSRGAQRVQIGYHAAGAVS